MPKFLLLTFSILFLASCQQYRYEVTYEKCNGQTGSTNWKSISDPRWYGGRDTAVPYIYNMNGSEKIINVCDFSYTKTPISDN